MKVTLNGHVTNLAEEATVAEAVLSLSTGDASMRGVAVAVNGEVVARSRWGDLRLRDDDRIEVLRAVGGG